MTGHDVDPASAAFFDAKYHADSDPWDFAGDPYERSRYERIVGFVDPRRHRDAYEPGCSVGVLTEMLARRCRHVDATDVSREAVGLARRRCAHLRNVTFSVGDLADPPGRWYDVVVFSEVGYYRPLAQLEHDVRELAARVRAGGRLVVAHWLGSSPDHRLGGDEVHEAIGRSLVAQNLADRSLAHWHLTHQERTIDPTHVGYRLDVWDRS